MEVIFVDEFLKLLGESVSQKTHDEIVPLVNACHKVDIDGELLSAVEFIRRYFKGEDCCG